MVDPVILQRRRALDARRAQQQRLQSGSAGFTDFDALLGLNRQITGNQSAGNLADIAGQRDLQLTDGQRQVLQQFFSPTVNAEQQSRLEALGKRASAQGLAGGAVRGQLGDLATRFVAGNRAASFQGVSDIVGARLGTIGASINPFLQQVGALRNARQDDVFRASGDTSQSFRQFAGVGLQALSSVGLGADALAGIAQRQGASFSGEGLTGAGDISQAFEQFLAPETQAFGQFLSNQGEQVSRGTAGFFSDFRGRSAAGGRLLARAQQRIGAGEQLAGRVGQIFQGFTQDAAALNAIGAANVSAFNTGSFGAAQQLANADLSQFSHLEQALGFGAGNRTGLGQAGQTSGTQFIAGNPLFRTIFGG